MGENTVFSKNKNEKSELYISEAHRITAIHTEQRNAFYLHLRPTCHDDTDGGICFITTHPTCRNDILRQKRAISRSVFIKPKNGRRGQKPPLLTTFIVKNGGFIMFNLQIRFFFLPWTSFVLRNKKPPQRRPSLQPQAPPCQP